MPGRTRTTKKLAQRIQLDYFKRLYPLPRWRRILSIGLVALGLVWLGWEGLAGNQHVYTGGPVAHSHAVFGLNCAACHVSHIFLKKATDQACLSCHDGPVHQAKQVFTPSCGSCHVEHVGAVRLAQTSDRACTRCHASLQTKDGHPSFAANITEFNGGHPEFASVRPGRSDPGAIKLNHKIHLKADLRGPHGPVQLQCADCHRPPGGKEPWPFGQAELSTVALSEPPPQPLPARVSARAYMATIHYSESCSACHPLYFDERFREPVPHKEPKVVYNFVVKKFTEYIAAHPEELRKPSLAEARIPGRPPRPAPRNAAEWVEQRVEDAELLLWEKTCKECHTLSFAAGASLPDVAKSAITVRWLPHAIFDHQAHQMLACTACHVQTATSEKTSEVLLPGIATCQQCHRSGRAEAAEARCFECHLYHDWTQEKPVKGKFTVPQLLSKAGRSPSPGSAAGRASIQP
ncbi:MAG: hypothetical protein HY236_06350 [Acidobacteria bacterium]|nr:hypothetical protein [Acidobacteriota bacterium]